MCFLCYLYFSQVEKKYLLITSFDDCVVAGYTVIPGSYPEECSIPGKRFINTRQQKEVSATKNEVVLPKYFGLTYLIDGSPATLSSGTSTLYVKEGAPLYEGVLTDDDLVDIVFIAKKGDLHYLLLALGLYNGAMAPANGISLGKDTPLAIVAKEGGMLQVEMDCGQKAQCIKKFIVKDGILEQSK